MAGLSKRFLYGWTELHVAADAGDLARVRHAVLKAPADLDRATKDGRTALHLAAANGFEAVVGELLDRQAKTTKQDESGRTPLHLAAAAGRSRCVAVLLGPRNRDSPAEKARLLALRDREGRDALIVAVVEGQAGAVEELLKAPGVEPRHCVDASQCGLVIVAVHRGHIHLLPPLLRACGGPDTQRDPANGGTALHLAALSGNLQMLECLLTAGASTTTRDNAGRTAAEAALAAGQHAAYRTLREAPARSGGAAAAAAPPLYDHNLLSPTGTAAQGRRVSGSDGSFSGGGGSATPWGEAPGWSAASPPGGPEASGVAAGRLQIPSQAPQPVYYPTPPSGAGVYF